jgi:hypothetical protein
VRGAGWRAEPLPGPAREGGVLGLAVTRRRARKGWVGAGRLGVSRSVPAPHSPNERTRHEHGSKT